LSGSANADPSGGPRLHAALDAARVAPRPHLHAALDAWRVAARRVAETGPVGLARMGGSSIAAPSAAGWITDFLNAAYYARDPDQRHVDDLRLAFYILGTSWHRRGRRLGLRDVAAYHRAFGTERRREAASGRGPTLDRGALLMGAERLFGEGFAVGYADPRRRGWGIVFPDGEARATYEPERRLGRGALRELTPPRRPPAEQRWHTYRPVPVASAERCLAAMAATHHWPDFGSELGRFTPVHRGGLAGQTFEIEVAARPTARTPVFMRAYVTATALLRREQEPQELERYVERLAADMAAGEAAGDGRPLPPGGRPYALVELTTHQGHFMGRAISRLLIFEREGSAFIRDVGSWDPLPPHLELPYRLGGHRAQVAFWGDGAPEQSMLHQLAQRVAEQPGAR
jgi:hypothetical protein